MVRGVTGVKEVDRVRGPVPQPCVRAGGVGRSGARARGPEPGTCIRIVGAGRLGVTRGEKYVEEVARVRGPGPQSHVRAGGMGRWDARASEPEPGTCIRIVGAGRLGVTRGVTDRGEAVVAGEAKCGRAHEPPPT